MEIKKAIKSLAAMAQETRLTVLKILVRYGNSGVPAGAISKELKIPHNTLSFHLLHLSNAGLVSSERSGRSIIYFANFKQIRKLTDYIMENCCDEGVDSCLSDKCGVSAKPKWSKNEKIGKKCVVQDCC